MTYFRGSWQELLAFLPPAERAELARADDEYEQRCRIAETHVRDVLEAMEAERGGTAT